MRKSATICDRCGHQSNGEFGWVGVVVGDRNDRVPTDRPNVIDVLQRAHVAGGMLDLCPGCFSAWRELMFLAWEEFVKAADKRADLKVVHTTKAGA